MTSTSETEKEALPLWQYASIDDYNLPAASVSHTARKSFAILRRLFRNDEPEENSLHKAEDELRTLPQWQLELISPAPDWSGAVEALNVELKDWLKQDRPDQPVLVLVGPPHSGQAEILTAWAGQQTRRVLTPPTIKQILAGDDTWLSSQTDNGGFWVFPGLEKAYLRHAAGLSLIRRFLDHAHSGSLGRGIIGCDSWAWAFLGHIWHGRQPFTLTLLASHQAQLAERFQRMADSANHTQLLFRQSDNGHYVLPPPDSNEDSTEMSNFLQRLAEHSRGIFGIARAVWRASLRTKSNDLTYQKTEKEDRKLAHQTIWVTPWDQLKHASVPSGAGRDEAFVLHTLLLHNGLPFELLPQLLPLSSSQTMETLSRLEEAGLVVRRNAVWQVSLLGYPAVRHFVQDNGYLVDQF